MCATNVQFFPPVSMLSFQPGSLEKTGTELGPRVPGQEGLMLISCLDIHSLNGLLTIRKTVAPIKHAETNASFSFYARGLPSESHSDDKNFLEKSTFEVIPRL